MAETYEMPENGWICFHCGERFHTIETATVHFGPTPDWTPECIERRTVSTPDLTSRLREAELYATKCQSDRDKAIVEQEIAEAGLDCLFGYFTKADTVTDVCNLHHSLEGRILAAEGVLRALEKSHPDIVLAAKIEVCGPGTYYPTQNLPCM